MNRNKITACVYRFLAFLGILFAAAVLFAALPGFSASKSLLFFVPLFLGAAVFAGRWAKQLEGNLGALRKALENLGKRDWEFPLPSSGIQDVWATFLAFHNERGRLREKFSQLEGEKEKLDKILANLREGILMADPANRIAVANESAGNLLSTPVSKLVGKSLDAFLEGPFRPVAQTLIRGEERSETIAVDPQTTVSFRTFLLKSADGSLLAKVCVLYDITQAKRLEETRKAFVANASHELRSPAAALQSLLDALEAGGLEDAAQREKFLGMMNREIARLNAVIRDLLDLSELEREKEFSRKRLNLSELFRGWLESYEARLREKEIRLHLDLESGLGLTGSEDDMEKLFRNLFENAVKYTPDKGLIEIGLRGDNGALLGWVKDTGPGIPPQHLERIFERFYRVDQSRSRALGGTGLGLSIAKHAVERHGGKIWAESERDCGSTFFFRMPLE